MRVPFLFSRSRFAHPLVCLQPYGRCRTSQFARRARPPTLIGETPPSSVGRSRPDPARRHSRPLPAHPHPSPAGAIIFDVEIGWEVEEVPKRGNRREVKEARCVILKVPGRRNIHFNQRGVWPGACALSTCISMAWVCALPTCIATLSRDGRSLPPVAPVSRLFFFGFPPGMRSIHPSCTTCAGGKSAYKEDPFLCSRRDCA